MPTKYFQVLENFDQSKHYNIKTSPNVLKCLELFKKGDIISPKKFAESNSKVINKRSSKVNATLYTVDRSIQIAKEIGLIQLVDDKPIKYADFCKLDSVQYFLNQLRGSKLKNLESDDMKENTTKRSYVQQIYTFNNWLHGKTFEFSTTKQIDIDVFKKTKEKITLDGIEHLLKLYQSSHNTESEYIKVVKMYLMDPINSKCSAKYMSVRHSAITSYFDKNDSPLRFKYNPNNNHIDYKEENENATITLDEVYKMITLGKASPLEKAVVLCRFHRGLDSSTFADRFNFQVWEQLVKWFGHSDFENWDLQKCPVPIRVSRVKTNYLHTGYLEHDAIIAIQDYLNFRHQLYVRMCKKSKIDAGYILEKNQLMQNGKPLFVNRSNRAVSVNWVSRLVPRLAVNAGIQKNLGGNRLQNKSEKIGHELRDLLKSTLIVSGAVDYVCQLAIGHKVGDSYEKQDKLYPKKSREEYAKASTRINIFTNVSNYVNNGDDSDKLKDQMAVLENRFDEKVNKKVAKIYETMQEEYAKRADIVFGDFVKKKSAILEEMVRETRLKERDYERKITELKGREVRQLVKRNGISMDVLNEFLIKSMSQQKTPLEAYTDFEEMICKDKKIQKEEELMHELDELSKKSGKTTLQIMSELVKTSKINTQIESKK